MTSFWINVWRKVIRRYHTFMHDYNSILYHDCLDIPMKIIIFQKIQHHQLKMNEYA